MKNQKSKEINEAIVQVMIELTEFATTSLIRHEGGLKVSYMGNFNQIWVTTSCLLDYTDIRFIEIPHDTKFIPDFVFAVKCTKEQIKKELVQKILVNKRAKEANHA